MSVWPPIIMYKHDNSLADFPLSGGIAPSRRQIVCGGLSALLASFSSNASAGLPEHDAPAFQAGRYQFTSLQPAQVLPPLTLFKLAGGTTDLSSLRGKPILLNFWATWCPGCRTELPILERIHEDRRANVHVIAISEDRGSRETVERFLTTLKIRALPIYRDPHGYVAFSDRDNVKNAPFGLYGMPITYLISSSGRIAGYVPGAAEWTTPSATNLIEYLRNS